MQFTLSFPEILFKVCNKCKIEKRVSEFNNCSGRKDGKFGSCRLCVKINFKPKTKEQARLHATKYRKNHPEKTKAVFKKWYYGNRDKILSKKRAFFKTAAGIDYLKEKHKRQTQEAKDRVNLNKRNRAKKRTPQQKMDKILRDRFNKVIIYMKRGVKFCSWRDLIGCTVGEVKLHIEKEFQQGMDWANHGNGKDKWNIDHIKPLKEFDLTDIEQQKIAFHYTNLRPLWFVDNMARNRKGYIE